MWRLVEHRYVTAGRADVGPFFELAGWDDADGHPLLHARLSQVVHSADEQRCFALADQVDLLLVIGLQREILLRQRADEISPEVRVKVKQDERRLPWSGPARVI